MFTLQTFVSFISGIRGLGLQEMGRGVGGGGLRGALGL